MDKKQESALERILAGDLLPAAATAAGVDPATVVDWLSNDSEFVAALNHKRRRQHEQDAQRLRSLAGDAVEAIAECLQSDNDRLRLQAASMVLKSCNLSDLPLPSKRVTAEGVEQEWRFESMAQLF